MAIIRVRRWVSGVINLLTKPSSSGLSLGPTLGPTVYNGYLHWAIWSSTVKPTLLVVSRE